MRIQKIEKLDHARYKNFTWNSAVKPFSDTANILFGWNGSGKTTLSKFFYKIEKGTKLESCAFKIKTDTKTFTENDSLEDIRSKIRVFNEDYVISTLTGDAKMPYIFFAGKDAVDYSKEEAKLGEKKKEFDKIVIPTNHDQIAKQTALLIKGVTGINSYKKELTGGGTYSSYDKSDFEKRFKDIQEKIAQQVLPSSSALIRTDIESLKLQLVNNDRLVNNNKEIAAAAQWVLDHFSEINSVLISTPIQELSKRIESFNPTEVKWIEHGVLLHFSEETQHDKCLFCNSDIKNANELLNHFSKEVVRALNSTDTFIAQIERHTVILAKLESPTTVQARNANKLRALFDQIISVLREKRNAISNKKPELSLKTEDLQPLTNITESDATSTAYMIETHFVAEKYQEYEAAISTLKKISKEREVLQKEITELADVVRTLRQKAKNTHEPAFALNELFKIVFPYRKIEISDNEDGTAYMLRRDGNNCPFATLSEGEKNFIALAYFIYSINDAQNKLANDGIVIVDDPVSSLDKQSIFQIFSIIANEIKKNQTRQYFIFTHNLDFLGHLKEYFRQGIIQGKVRLMSCSASLAGCLIEDIHQLLKDHRSDYYYAFSVLYRLKDVCTPEESYLAVNLLRRWLETFLEFKLSSPGDLAGKIESVYTEAKKTTEKWKNPFNANYLEMYRFINHGSHGFPDTESIDESVLLNASARIQDAFQMVKIIDPMHYKKLEALV